MLTCAALAACAIALAGVDAGLLWLVAGVWTTRAAAGAPVGVTWGIACLGAGLRWGTTSLGDVAVATRLSGPTVAAGPFVVRAGMIAALLGAVLDEIRGGGLRAEAWDQRAAAGISLVALVALYLVRGPADPSSSLPVLWGGLAAAGAAVALQVHPVVRPMPALVPVALVAGGITLAVAGG